MTPSLAWHTQVSFLPWTGRHLVPVGGAGVRATISNGRESRDSSTMLDIDNIMIQCTLQLQIYQKSGKGCVVVVYRTPATVNIIIL